LKKLILLVAACPVLIPACIIYSLVYQHVGTESFIYQSPLLVVPYNKKLCYSLTDFKSFLQPQLACTSQLFLDR